MDRIIGALLLGLCVSPFLLLGVGLGIWYLRERRKFQESQHWAATEGKVEEAFVHRSERVDEDTGRVSVTFYPRVRYSYVVNGEEYIGTHIAFGGQQGYSRPAQAEAVLARYPEGGRVTVYYNPDNPREAVLERRMSTPWVLLAVGFFFFALALCVVLPLALRVIHLVLGK